MKKSFVSIVLSAAMLMTCILPVSAAGELEDQIPVMEEMQEDAGNAASIKNLTIKLSNTSYVYDGKVKTPSVSVKDSKGNTVPSSKYKVTYPSGRKNVNKYTVKVAFKNGYTGTKNLTFVIVPKETAIKSFTAGSNYITVKYSKQASQTSGYEIMYATKGNLSDGSTIKINSNGTTSKKITGLKAGTKYYFKIRTFRKVGSKTYNSAWSAVKNTKTKTGTNNTPSKDINDYNLSYNAISKLLTVKGKELSKYTYGDFESYLKNHPSKPVVYTYTSSDSVRTFYVVSAGDESYLLGKTWNDSAEIYLEKGSRMSVGNGYVSLLYQQVPDFRWVGIWDDEGNNVTAGINHNYNKDLSVKGFITTPGKELFNSIKAGLLDLLTINDGSSDKVINMKGGQIKDRLPVSSGAGTVTFSYSNGNEIYIDVNNEFNYVNFEKK